MLRAALIVCFAFASLNAGFLFGARFGMADQKGEYKGDSTSPSDARPWGAGAALGYEFDGFRVLASLDDFDKEKKATLTTIGVHMIETQDEFIHGFLGIDIGQLDYRHKSAPKSEDVTVGGLAIGLILLDDRFPNMQMELAYRYLKRFGSLPDDLKVNDVQHVYIGLGFNFNAF
jgi:hypothetical protein